MIRPIAGFVMLVMAAGLAIWMGYNLLIERLRDSEGISIVPALTFMAALAYVGGKMDPRQNCVMKKPRQPLAQQLKSPPYRTAKAGEREFA